MSLENTEGDNPLEIFQIWVNLPTKSKKVKPHFTMLWAEKNPVLKTDLSTVTVIADEAKQYSDKVQSPPPESWASEPGSELAVLLIDLQPGGRVELPAAKTRLCHQSQTLLLRRKRSSEGGSSNFGAGQPRTAD